MRLLWTGLLLPLAASCAAINQRRQITPEMLEGLMAANGLMPLMPWIFGIDEPKSVRSDKSWNLQPEIQKNATRKLMRWGPFGIPGIPKPGVRNIITIKVSKKQLTKPNRKKLNGFQVFKAWIQWELS
jgi:hypothetical protein